MKIIAINGSPRKDCNSAKMLQKWVEGFKYIFPEVEVKWVDLYSLTYTGCRSCFSCKRKNGKFYGQCPIKDDIHDLIPEVYDADAVAFACPIYFGELGAYTRCFLERALFCKTSYRLHHDSLAPKPVPVTMIYSMNCPKDMASELHYEQHWNDIEAYISNAFRYPSKRVCAYNTYQFRNYADYEMEMFNEEEKRHYRDEHFPIDEKTAYYAGMDTAENLPNT
ncbi:MAG: flavodoxin family protein [Muribaculaceae bacterium]|nr:flavodoxin family protein [Muribaculaceae bacterium]